MITKGTKLNINKPVYILIDCILNLASWISALAIYINFNYTTNLSFQNFSAFKVIIIFLICIISFQLFGVYKSLWQHGGLGSVIRLSLASFLTTILVYVSSFFLINYWANPIIPIMAFYFLLTTSLIVRLYKKSYGLIRSYIKTYISHYVYSENMEKTKKRTLLVGAGDTAYSFLRNAVDNQEREVICIVDNDLKKQGYAINGINIMGDDNKIPYLVKRYNINEIIIAVPSMSSENIKRIMRLSPSDSCAIKRISGLSNTNNKGTGKINDINIGDILGREENIPDTSIVSNWVNGKTVLITGGGGSIGSEICNQILKHDIHKLIVYDISENNAFNLLRELILTYGNDIKEKVILRVGSVQDEVRLNSVFKEFKPNIVFHAAAYKHVPFMEESPRLAFNNNTIGTLITARYSYRYNVQRFVLVSTDKAVNPANVMGATKRLSELVVLGLNAQRTTEYVCVRFGNVLDSNGSVVPTFKSQIAAGGPVTLTHPDITRYFMTIPEAAQLVLEAGAIAKGGEIFVLDMGEPVKIKDLAENVILLAGFTPNVDIKIEITGLRPGEKLYEELLLNTEGLEKTPNNKIFVVKPPFPEDFHLLVQVLMQYVGNDNNEQEVFNLIKRFVPEYLGSFPEDFIESNQNNYDFHIENPTKITDQSVS